MTALIGRMLNTIVYAAFLVLVTFTSSASGAEDNRDMKMVIDRITKPLLEREVDTGKVEQLLKALKPDGSWEGIDYRDKTRAGWKTSRHLSKLTVLVLAYKSPKSRLRNSPGLKKGIFASLDYWLKHDFQNPNWWHNVIGVPRKLGPVLLVLGNELTAAQRKKGAAILKRAKPGMTGQNLVWVSEITIGRGLLEGNPKLVKSAFKRIADEIRVTGREGIQQDFSFHQHGNCLYNHGYGAGFAVDCSRLAGLAAKTRFAFPGEKINILASYVLDGSQWMAYGNAGDYGAEGREITRPGQTAGYLLKAASYLLKLPTGREKELKALLARGADRAKAPLEGNRNFWASDIMTHLRKNYYASARMYSTRMDNTDSPSNNEGLKSHHIADGCNFLLVSGDEYKDIFPVWNWQRIPGTTVAQTGTFKESPRRKGARAFVGGVSDGRYGLAAIDFERNTLRAHKAWFFFDREYVCLGAGITCPAKQQVLTTVNQCYLRGEVTTFDATGGKRLPKGKHRLKSPTIIHHNNVVYVMAGNVLLQNISQEGNWYRISKSRSKDKISHDVFTLCIDHGAMPKNAAYSYIVCPGMDRKQAQAYAKEPGVEVLSNTTDIQAVKHRKLKISQIAFFKSGSLKIDQKTTVTTNKPCLVMVRQVAGEFRLAISDPTQKLKTIKVGVSGKLQGKGCTYDPQKNISTVSLTLPTGGYAGKSIVAMFRKAD
jgi:chondroitin AC lyase